jgi:hypothetical protein
MFQLLQSHVVVVILCCCNNLFGVVAITYSRCLTGFNLFVATIYLVLLQ